MLAGVGEAFVFMDAVLRVWLIEGRLLFGGVSSEFSLSRMQGGADAPNIAIDRDASKIDLPWGIFIVGMRLDPAAAAARRCVSRAHRPPGRPITPQPHRNPILNAF